MLFAISVTPGAETGEKEIMTIIDFSRGDVIWPHINDGVMGGVSSGAMSAADGYATFRGTVSFDNNGGFSSVRSPAVVRDLSPFDGLVLRVRGDGKRYGFRLKTGIGISTGRVFSGILGSLRKKEYRKPHIISKEEYPIEKKIIWQMPNYFWR